MKRLVLVFAGMVLVAVAMFVQTAAGQEDPGRLLKQLEDDSDRFSNGVSKALELLHAEIDVNLALLGRAGVKEMDRSAASWLAD